MFEIEFRTLIVTNHELSIEGINRIEKEDLADVIDREERAWHQRYFDDPRTATNNLQWWRLVTRLDHWVTSLLRGQKLREDKPGKTESRTIKKMEALNRKLGDGPVPLQFLKRW